MAKKSTISTTSAASLSTDEFIMDALDAENSGLSTGEKVAIGFGIASAAMILGFIIYDGIRYLVTKSDNRYYTIPVQNVSPGTQQLPTQQYAQYIQPQQMPKMQHSMTPTPQPAPDSVDTAFNELHQASNNFNDLAIKMANTIVAQNEELKKIKAENKITDSQPQVITAEQLVPIINGLVQQVGTLNSNQQQMVAVMGTMSEAIQNRNSAEVMGLQNENTALKQQVNAANVDRERAESIASHMQGQYDNLASQVGAPLSNQFFQNIYGNPAGSVVKYPDVNVNDIVR